MPIKQSQDEEWCFIVSTEVENDSGGAYANVYSTAEDEQSALHVATREIEDAGWAIVHLPRASKVSRKDFGADRLDGLEYFEQALVDGIVLVVHTFPDSLQH